MAIRIGTTNNDTIQGGVENDFIFGLAGDDFLQGGAGNDFIVGDNGNDTLIGEAGDDRLIGGAGRDLLSGREGNDMMSGGTGDDTYVVDAIGDVVEEKKGEGKDQVVSSLENYTLGANVEDLILVGNSLRGIGNDLNNKITGNDKNNGLSGEKGNDVLIGAGGDDLIAGDAGNDTLTGGTGSDLFRYRLETIATSGGTDVDVITDFQSGTDKLVLNGLFPTGFSQQVAIVDDDTAAALSEAQVVYSRTSGSVFFNTNQTEAGFGTGGKFITLQGSALTSSDVMFVFEGLIGSSI